MKRSSLACTFLLLTFLGGCTSVEVTSLPKSGGYDKICIEKNDKVIVPNFLKIIINRIEDHGIKTIVYIGKLPKICDIYLKYTALQTWDFALYLSHSELHIYDRSGNVIAKGVYHLNGKGGLSLTKWASVESKINPVVDEIFASYIGNEPIPEGQRNTAINIYQSSENNKDEGARLKKLTELHVKGLITDEEYAEKRNEILEDI